MIKTWKMEQKEFIIAIIIVDLKIFTNTRIVILCIMRIFDEHSFFFFNFINNVNFCKIIAILNNFSTNICTSFDYVRLIKGYGN